MKETTHWVVSLYLAYLYMKGSFCLSVFIRFLSFISDAILSLISRKKFLIAVSMYFL
jgi:hypothetical protein